MFETVDCHKRRQDYQELDNDAVAPLIGSLSGSSASDWSDQSVTYLGYHHLARVTFC